MTTHNFLNQAIKTISAKNESDPVLFHEHDK